MSDEPEQEKQPKVIPAKKPKMVKVRLIASSGRSRLVEYLHDDRLFRCYVPDKDILGDMADLEKLQSGIAYGVDWSQIGSLSIDPVALDVELKRNGIYTLAEFQAEPQLVNLILARIAGATKAKLVKFAKDKEA